MAETHPSEPEAPVGRSVHQRSQDPAYAEIARSAEFAELRQRYRRFAFPWAAAFLGWYLLYVVMSNWAHDFMSARVLGHINVALVFGLLQFVSTFLIARLYATHAARSLDPLADDLRRRYDEGR